MKKTLILIAFALLSLAQHAAAQDVVERGRRNRTPLPRWMQRELARDPGAFEFQRAWKSELEEVREARARLRARGVDPQRLAPRQAAAQGAAVQGTYRVPVFPLLYSNTPSQPYDASVLQNKLYSSPAPALTLTRLYTEMSRGLVNLTGTVHPWTRAVQADSVYEGEDNGSPPALGLLLKEVLDRIDPTVDFRQYDSNGDGYVDFVAFVHPERGGECGPASTNRNIWSHRWTYAGAGGGQYGSFYQTNDGVRISDYVIQPAYNCDGTSTVEIGVFAHEYGHAFGLPDLYSTSNANDGIGVWGLMGAGNYNRTHSPAHMEAWSKVELGWMPVVTLSRTASGVRIDPAETVGSAVRIDIPPAAGSTAPSGEYFLLENRQRIGYDQFLHSSGLLIWHVDSLQIAATRRTNTVQNNTSRKGLDLEEADGRADLDRVGARGDSGDPYPGTSGNRSFGLATNPNSNSNRGYTSGVSIGNITETVGGPVTFDLTIGPGGVVVLYWGDVTGDGTIGQADVDAVLRESIGRASGVSGLSRGDVDADGDVDGRDALIIQSYTDGVDVSRFRVGKPVSTPVSQPLTRSAPDRVQPARGLEQEIRP
ncbi:MAG TPA: M6 family metalloprotease domain-containing protein [Longimicrobiaceae bacterium]|nr:M6 family metalloprotease domain-containing protein [Longimicrobiaceae bacterium]